MIGRGARPHNSIASHHSPGATTTRCAASGSRQQLSARMQLESSESMAQSASSISLTRPQAASSLVTRCACITTQAACRRSTQQRGTPPWSLGCHAAALLWQHTVLHCCGAMLCRSCGQILFCAVVTRAFRYRSAKSVCHYDKAWSLPMAQNTIIDACGVMRSYPVYGCRGCVAMWSTMFLALQRPRHVSRHNNEAIWAYTIRLQRPYFAMAYSVPCPHAMPPCAILASPCAMCH